MCCCCCFAALFVCVPLITHYFCLGKFLEAVAKLFNYSRDTLLTNVHTHTNTSTYTTLARLKRWQHLSKPPARTNTCSWWEWATYTHTHTLSIVMQLVSYFRAKNWINLFVVGQTNVQVWVATKDKHRALAWLRWSANSLMHTQLTLSVDPNFLYPPISPKEPRISAKILI